MHTHKWLSNSPVVLSEIPLQDRVNKINFEEVRKLTFSEENLMHCG